MTHSAADRLDWVRSIEACSHQQIDLQIKQLEEQIAAATAAKRTAAAAIGIGTGSGTVMGNRIDQGLPLPTNMFPDSWPASASSATAEAPFEGDLIQF